MRQKSSVHPVHPILARHRLLPFAMMSATPALTTWCDEEDEVKKLCFGYSSGHSPPLSQDEQNQD